MIFGLKNKLIAFSVGVNESSAHVLYFVAFSLVSWLIIVMLVVYQLKKVRGNRGV